MVDATLNYRSLLANADAEARHEYDFDPRVTFLQTANHDEVHVEPVNYVPPTTLSGTQPTIQELTEAPETLDTLTLPVQQPPEMVPHSRMVIIDTAQRDWTLQTDAYSNVFSFGTQSPHSNDGPQSSYYFNNPTIPLAAIKHRPMLSKFKQESQSRRLRILHRSHLPPRRRSPPISVPLIRDLSPLRMDGLL